jgi:hypothetical protein
MKKNYQFLKDLVDSDFLLIDSPKKPIYHHNKKYFIRAKYNYSIVLDLIESNQNLKQFIRNLQYLTKKRVHLLQILIGNEYLEELFRETILEEKLDNKIKTITVFSQAKNLQKIQNVFLAIGNRPEELSDYYFLEKNLLLVNEINLNISLRCAGHYRLYNDIKNLNKSTFVLSIICQVLKIHYESRK